jgi:asparagine N-glycosylation enzyme membrane subunit Stt3
MENENKILEERKEKLLHFFKTDKFLSAFVIVALVALLFSGLVKLGVTPIIGVFSAKIWFMLFIFSAISAVLAYFKKHGLAFLPIAAWIAWLALEIRTLNLSGLRDVTTGGWTLGPDLDPFLFLRWGKYIIEHGSMMAHDAMRFVPLGFDTSRELLGVPYSIVLFHKIASMFGSSSVEQSAALMPAFVFMIGVIPFFFLVRKLFINSLGNKKSSIIALIASFLVAVIPTFIPRTVAGIPEKESVGIPLMFFAFCFFIYAWDAKKTWTRITLSLLAGVSTALMALTWGGFIYIYAAIGIAVLIAFLLGKMDMQKAYIYSIWLASSIALLVSLTNRYTVSGLASSPTTGLSMLIFGIIVVDIIINKTKLRHYLDSPKLSKIPKPVISIVVTLLLGLILSTIVFGISFPLGVFNDIKGNLISPTVDRLGVTVAENKQPYFSEWADSFGPTIKGIPLSFWLFFFGSVFLFWKMTNHLPKKERIISTSSYLLFLVCIIFSRYSASSAMNGTGALSIIVYLIGFIALIGSLGFVYFSHHKRGEFEKLKELDFNLIWILGFFFLTLISARGAIRLTMMLVPPAAIIISYFAIASLDSARKVTDGTLKVVAWVTVALVLISTAFAGYQFYLGAESTAKGYIPSSYNQQWQKAMSWVRDNTPQGAVFGHWWDYGYWLQSIGNRATVLDGGNSIPYWDHLMGRYALTGRNETDALEFLYTHDTTHFLIDSSDIGKYPAFSSIGSDENYDRYSWFNTFTKDARQTQETKNSTLTVYTGGFPLDGDIIYNDNGTKIFIPSGTQGGLAAVIVERDASGKMSTNPIGVFIYQNKQIRIPLRYAYDGKLIDFDSGFDAGIFLFPYISQSDKGISIDPTGAMMYLSSKTVQSQLARLYLYKEDDKFFKLVHSEDDFIVAQLKASNATNSDIVYYQGLRGPIRIWEINYPDGMEKNPAYLETQYPDARLAEAKQ